MALEKMPRVFLIVYLIINIYSLDITSFQIHFFKENSKLYYVNAMNDINGDLYFEFWGENDNKRYFIGKSYLTEEQIKFNDNEIFSIETNTVSKYHESIIININNNVNVLSMDMNYFDFINIKDSVYSYEPTKNIAFKNDGTPAYRNCLIKLKDNT